MSSNDRDLIAELGLRGRPGLWSRYTTDQLWCDPHIAKRMLEAHLNPDHDRASRRPEKIQATAQWLDDQVGLEGKKLCDLGCGPGLYASEFAKAGANVTGLDFSELAISYACDHFTGILFQQGDYLNDPLPADQDVITLIFCDYGALNPDLRQQLLNKTRAALKPGGILLFDAFHKSAFDDFSEIELQADNLMAGFWSPDPYVGVRQCFRYDDDLVGLERFVIVGESRQREIYNWTQYFDHELLAGELAMAGFQNVEFPDGPFGDPDLIWVLARKS